MKGVADARGVRHDLPDELVLLVDVDRKLVAEMAFTMPLGPGHIGVVLPAMGRLQIRGCRFLIDDLFILADDFLLLGWEQGGIDHLPIPSDKAFLQDLF